MDIKVKNRDYSKIRYIQKTSLASDQLVIGLVTIERKSEVKKRGEKRKKNRNKKKLNQSGYAIFTCRCDATQRNAAAPRYLIVNRGVSAENRIYLLIAFIIKKIDASSTADI